MPLTLKYLLRTAKTKTGGSNMITETAMTGPQLVRAGPDGPLGRWVGRLAALLRHPTRRTGRAGDHRRLGRLPRHRQARLHLRAAQPTSCPRPRTGPEVSCSPASIG